MPQFEAYDHTVEVNGQTVLAFVDGVPNGFEDKAREVLADNGIESPTPGNWYSQQTLLDAFAQLSTEVGPATVTKIGEAIPENAEWPAEVDTVVGALESIDDAYYANHRGGRIGHYDAERVDAERLRVRCDNPYPCAFDEGIVRAVAAEFVEFGAPRVHEVGEECRADGGEACVYEVEL